MKSKVFASLVTLGFVLLLSGCASPTTQYGKSEFNVLGGLVRYEEGGYAERGPLTIGVESSTFFPRADLDGDSVSLFWGLFTYVDD